MFDAFTTHAPRKSNLERLSLLLVFVLTAACLVAGVFALRGTARLLAVNEPAPRATEVVLVSLDAAHARDGRCVDSTGDVHYAPKGTGPQPVCLDETQAR